MSKTVQVTADVHERASGIPDALAALGVGVELVALPAGDYAIGQTILVERKSLSDLHGTILKGRFWRQVDKLRRATGLPFLLVEGEHLDDGPIAPNAIRGICLAVVARGIRLIRTEDRRDSTLWLQAMAVRAAARDSSDRPAYAQRPRPDGVREAAEAMLAAVPGISKVSARALLHKFGSVAAVASAGPEAWTEVPGIGPERARALAETLNLPYANTAPTASPREARNRLST